MNPYRAWLLGLSFAALITAVILWIVGYNLTSNFTFSDEETPGAGELAAAAGFLQVGTIGFLVWLGVKAIDWRATPTEEQ